MKPSAPARLAVEARALLARLSVSAAAQGVGQDKLVVRAGGRHHAGRVTLTGPKAERNHAAELLRAHGWMATAWTSRWAFPYPGTFYVLTPPEVLVGSAEPRSGP